MSLVSRSIGLVGVSTAVAGPPGPQRGNRVLRSAFEFLKTQASVRPESLGMIGYCGGGRKSLVMAAESRAVKIVVAFYATPRFTAYHNAQDPIVDAIDVAARIQVPVQCYYGLLDRVALPDDARELETRLRRSDGAPIEFYYYEGAGHGFCDENWSPETTRMERSATILRRRILQRVARSRS